MDTKLLLLIPGVEPNELVYLESLTKDLSEEQLQTFAAFYNGDRKKSDIIMIGAIIGLLGVGGVQRFMVNQVGMGFLYFLTAGLCFIGTIVDLVNYKKLTFEYNQEVAHNVHRAVKNMK